MKEQWRETTEHEFDHLVGPRSGIVLVYFYARWCEASVLQAKVLRDLPDSEYRDIILLRINVDYSRKIAMEQGIRSVPSLVLYDQGEIIDYRVGVASAIDLSVLLAQARYKIDTSSHYQFDSSPYCQINGSKSVPCGVSAQ